MNVTYTGVHHGMPPKVQSKLNSKFSKLSKLLEKRGEREAHVIIREERGKTLAEITIQFYDHQLVAEGKGPDLFGALSPALEKLEAQAIKQRDKWREKHRREDPPVEKTAEEPKAASAGVRIHRVSVGRKKPITLDEALLLLDSGKTYLAYRDAQTERISILVRRPDAGLDLIES